MTDYDKTKVSPRPWKIFWSGEDTVGIIDGAGRWVHGTERLFWEAQMELGRSNLDHIVHCVNIHDELVAALDEFLDDLPDDCTDLYCTRMRDLIARAKGES